MYHGFAVRPPISRTAWAALLYWAVRVTPSVSRDSAAARSLRPWFSRSISWIERVRLSVGPPRDCPAAEFEKVVAQTADVGLELGTGRGLAQARRVAGKEFVEPGDRMIDVRSDRPIGGCERRCCRRHDDDSRKAERIGDRVHALADVSPGRFESGSPLEVKQPALRAPHLAPGVAESAFDFCNRRLDREQPAKPLEPLEQVGEIGHERVAARRGRGRRRWLCRSEPTTRLAATWASRRNGSRRTAASRGGNCLGGRV